jgi:small subunit ribosomal protein S17
MSEETVNEEGAAVAPENAALSDDRTATSLMPAAPAQQSDVPKRHLRKTRVGQVVSNKMDKTIVVEVVRRVPHAKFGKIVKRTKKLYAHDEKNQCSIGDLVRVEETRPLSRLKRWQLVEVLKH